MREYLAPPPAPKLANEILQVPRLTAGQLGPVGLVRRRPVIAERSLGIDLVHDQPRNARDDNDHKDREHALWCFHSSE